MPGLEVPTLIAAFTLIPGKTGRYICFAIALTLLAFRAARRQTPTRKVSKLKNAIAATKNTLAQAQSACTGGAMTLFEQKVRLLQ